MTTWIERLVQQAHTKSRSLGWSPKTKLEQPPADGPRSRPFPCSTVQDIWTPPLLGACVARSQPGLGFRSFDSPLVPSAVQATWTPTLR